MNEQVTLMHPGERDQSARGISSGFPVDLLTQSAGRLRVLALLYAFVYFMAGIFPALLFAEDRARFFGSVLQWSPSVLAIGVALLVAAVIRSPRLPLPTAGNIGLAFEIVSSYAIAAGEFADPMGLEMHGGGHMGLSWVAVWVVLFTVVVPTPPRRALLAALASVSSVPVTIGLIMVSGVTSTRLDPGQFFFGLVFPYLLVVGMAYVGARVVYYLGTEVKRARELGSYRLEEKLGEGGMGEVWRARHRMLARPAAIKLIRPSFARDARGGVSEEAVSRFEREAQVIARLRSTHMWSSSISGWPMTAPSITSWNCSTASMPTRYCGGSGPPRPNGPSTCFARSVTRCQRPSHADWSIVTSNPRTSSSAGTARSMTL